MATRANKEKKTPNRATGKTLGLGVQATWAKVLKSNSSAKMTDAQITKFMNTEFPGRKSAVFDRVQHVRAQYNRGVFSEDGKAPAVASFRYGEDGKKQEGRAKVVKVKPKAKMVIKKKAA